MYRDSNRDFASKLLMSYMVKKLYGTANESQKLDYDSNEVPILSKIAYKRMEALSHAANIDGMIINISDEFYLILSVMANGPGCALIMLHKLIESAAKLNGGKLKPGYTMDEAAFIETFPIFYDTSESDVDRKLWEDIWDSQKDENGKNKVDQVSYWTELFDLEVE